MNRQEIKAQAKEKIKGHVWELAWPALVIGLIYYVISRLLGINNIDLNSTVSVADNAKGFILEIIFSVIMGGYIKYVMDFVRNDKTELNTIVNTIKEKWLNLLIANLLVELIVFVGSMLLVIPGIIALVGLSFVSYIVVDSDTSGTDAIKKSWEMMKGYKWDLFVFSLSFLGWMLLGVLTIGILYIWLLPYVSVACVIYFDKLKELK